MRKFLKLLLILAGGLAALLLVAVLAVSLFFDPNDYKDEIRELVRKETGRELTIDGDIEWSFFPWVGVEAGPVTLSNAQGFGPRPFARVERAGINVKLLPLIQRRVEVDTIILNGADVNLGRDAQGTTNWQDLVPEAQEPADTEAAGAGIAGLVVSGVQLRDSTISWHDARAGTQYTARGIDLETSEITLGSPFHMRMGFNLSSDTSGLSARVTVEATPTVGVDFQRAELADFEFALDGAIQGTDGETPLDIGVTAEASVDLAAGTAELRGLEIDAWNVSATGEGRVTQLNTAPQYEARLEVAEFSPRTLLETLTGSAPETSDGDVLSSAAASLTAEGDGDSASVALGRAHLDDTRLSGTFEVVAFSPLATRFDLEVGAIDLDRYLSPEQQTASSDAPLATPGEAAAAGGSLIPAETLRGLDTRGRIHADELKVSGLTATDVNINIKASNGQVRIHPLEAGFYQGKYTGDIRIDARGARPTLSMDERVQGVNAGPLLQDAAGRAWMTGVGGLSLKSTADLSSPEAAKRSLSGRFSLDFREGAIFGINIAQRIRQAAAMLQGQSVSLAADEQKTDFSSFVVNAQMDRGVVRAETVRLVSPLLEITGGGTVNLVDSAVDLSFLPVLKGALGGAGGSTLDKLVGKPIPLKFSGSITSPSINLDLAAALKGEVKERLGQELLRQLDKRDSKEGGDEDGGGGTAGDQSTVEDQESVEDRLKREALQRLLGGEEEPEAADDQQDQSGPATAEERKAARRAERRKARQQADEETAESDDGGR